MMKAPGITPSATLLLKIRLLLQIISGLREQRGGEERWRDRRQAAAPSWQRPMRHCTGHYAALC